MTSEEYLELSSKKNWKYHVLVSHPAAVNLEYIHPLNQELVNKIAERASEDSNVKRIIIFGSSITNRCNPFSDLDLCIDWRMRSHDDDGVFVPETNAFMKFIAIETKGNVDILAYDDIENPLMRKSIDEGVVVYEQKGDV